MKYATSCSGETMFGNPFGLPEHRNGGFAQVRSPKGLRTSEGFAQVQHLRKASVTLAVILENRHLTTISKKNN